MVTPRIPGAVRGRPKGSRRDLRDEPDRFAVAYGLALQVLGASQRKAFLMAAAMTPSSVEAAPDLSFHPAQDGVRQSFELRPRPRPLRSTKRKHEKPTFKARAWALAKKATRTDYSPEEAMFLKGLAAAIVLAMTGREEVASIAHALVERALSPPELK